MGKDILTRYMRLYCDEYDLSGDARTVDSLNRSWGEVNMRGWSDAHNMYASDHVMDIGIRGFQAFANDNTGGAFDKLKDAGTHTVSLLFGTGGEPAHGDPAYLLSGVQLSSSTNIQDNAAVIQADFVPETDEGHNPFGVVLNVAALSTTTQTASIDGGADSSAGFQANIHMIAVGADAVWSMKIDHSQNGSDWSELKAFTLTGDAINSEHISSTGTVYRYIRFNATKTSGGNITPIVTFARN